MSEYTEVEQPFQAQLATQGWTVMHVPIIGKRPPSTLDETIDMQKAGKGTFEGGARRLEMNDGHTVFTDLRIKVKDVKLVVAKMSEKVFPDGKG